ncbi:MAG: metallophosphoesterase family protein [Terracidiphilus sp.]
MRIAIVSDIHGNLTAFEAVVADLRQTSPDVIFHGGDLAASGSSPCEIIDRVRELGWPGVVGNADEMLFDPGKLKQFAEQSAGFRPFYPIVEEMAAATRALLGEERIAWLRALAPVQMLDDAALVHATPGDPWRAPLPEVGDEELVSAFESLGQPIAVYAHIHRSFIRHTARMTVANTGSVSLSYDGDRRAAYMVIDGSNIGIRRLEYDIEREIMLLRPCGLPHSDWIARTIESGSFQMP